MEKSIITVKDFYKNYGDVKAVNGISFEVFEGEIFGLLGPNGAGKTSTLECLEGLRFPDGGTLLVKGINPSRQSRDLRNLIGVQLQTSGLPETITVDEAIRFFSAYHDIVPNYELMSRLGLREQKKTQYYQLSEGQKRRLSLALALNHNPEILFLDEPTAGLDVPARAELHTIIRELKASGTTIILATHDMAEAEEMADRIAILLRGQIVASGSPLEITAAGRGFTRISVRTKHSCLLGLSVDLPAVEKRIVRDEYNIWYSTDVTATVLSVMEHIKSHKDILIDMRIERPSLEERFLELINVGAEE